MSNSHEPLNETERRTLEVIYRWKFDPYPFFPYTDNNPATQAEMDKCHRLYPVPYTILSPVIRHMFHNPLLDNKCFEKGATGVKVALDVLEEYDYIKFSEANPLGTSTGTWILSDTLSVEVTDDPPVIRIYVDKHLRTSRFSKKLEVKYSSPFGVKELCCSLTKRGLQRARQILDIPGNVSTKHMSGDEANIKARELLMENPGFANKTEREWAEAIGCSPGLVAKLTAWKAVMEQRRKEKPNKLKAVTLTSEIMDKTPQETEKDALKSLIAEQKADYEPNSLEDDPPSSPPKQVKHHKIL